MRWGGEEFAILLPRATQAQAERVAEELRQVIATEPFEQAGVVTSSFGVSVVQWADGLDASLQKADEALYLAKAAGRNRVAATSPGANSAAGESVVI